MARILLIQYAGDYLGAYNELSTRQSESYYGHGYVLAQLESMRREHDEVAVMCCLSPTRYDTVLPTGVRVIGAKCHPRRDLRAVLRTVARVNPTHVVVLFPAQELVAVLGLQGRRILCVFADSLTRSDLVGRAKRAGLRSVLNWSRVEWVANHGHSATRWLASIGVFPEKVLPWDWPREDRFADVPIKDGPSGWPSKLLYVGLMHESKGVGDAVQAVAELSKRKIAVDLEMIGNGDVSRFQGMARHLGVADRVRFSGPMPNTVVRRKMREADVVLVPSRHEYPEGMPLTIYEALEARTPLLVSDHPMFLGHLRAGVNAGIFPAGDADRLASVVADLLVDHRLYSQCSRNSYATWKALQVPNYWGDVISHWCRGQAEDVDWLKERTISAP